MTSPKSQIKERNQGPSKSRIASAAFAMIATGLVFLVPFVGAGELVGKASAVSCSSTIQVSCARAWISAYDDGCYQAPLSGDYICHYHFDWGASGSSILPGSLDANLYVDGWWKGWQGCSWDTEGGCGVGPKTYSGDVRIPYCGLAVTVTGKVVAETTAVGWVKSGAAVATAPPLVLKPC